MKRLNLCAFFTLFACLICSAAEPLIDISAAPPADSVKPDQIAQEAYLQELMETIRKPKVKEVFEGLQVNHVNTHSQPYKAWTILIYIAGDNNLYNFAIRNIEQLKQIGSNQLLNIVIHFDYHQPPQPKATRRFYVEHNNLLQIGKNQAMDSGSEATLIDAATWAVNNYPSDNFALVLWNHGSGDLNPGGYSRLINPSDLFYYNPETKKIELDRSISFFDFLARQACERGICFDDTTGHYLDDRKLTTALQEIVRLRGGRKIDIVLMDACLMAGIGTAYLFSKYTRYMTASEEVVLGPGYNYATLLKPLSIRNILPIEFAKHAVDTYAATYGPVTNDYTESAFDLNFAEAMATNLNSLATVITHFLPFDTNKLISRTIRLCASNELCTHFDEQSYKDLRHFYENLLTHCSRISVKDTAGNDFYTMLKQVLEDGLFFHQKLVIKNVSGKNYPRAAGVTLYFPGPGMIHPSFANTVFGKTGGWLSLLSSIQ